MERDESQSAARRIMVEFADATGLSAAGAAPRRYLWTDAFAVCNYLGLHRETGEERFKRFALDLIDQVHGILGRHRIDDPRTGWISGLNNAEGAFHPTRGGLRIGKTLNERQPGEPFDERREWNRDGQYYHYLTKWMHALHATGHALGDRVYIDWAVELAKAAHGGFVYSAYAGDRKKMFWKMSIDLSRPLVTSMGHHDPLDGLITLTGLQAALQGEYAVSKETDLGNEIADLISMCKGVNWTTDDPLGLGGLLFDACRIGALMVRGYFGSGVLLEELLHASLAGLASFIQSNALSRSARYRLAFRELGLSIGLRAAGRLWDVMEKNPRPFGDARRFRPAIEAMRQYERFAETIESFWLEPANREADTWEEHRDINRVMLATSLAPGGLLSS